jgi:hypothetical protein
MATMKTTQRNRLTLKNDVFLCVSTIDQYTENLEKQKIYILLIAYVFYDVCFRSK